MWLWIGSWFVQTSYEGHFGPNEEIQICVKYWIILRNHH